MKNVKQIFAPMRKNLFRIILMDVNGKKNAVETETNYECGRFARVLLQFIKEMEYEKRCCKINEEKRKVIK